MFIMETTFAYVGTAASIVGLVVAAIQTVRARQLRRYADHLERIRRVNVWAFIGMTLEAFDTLDELREIEIAECNEAQIAAKIASAPFSWNAVPATPEGGRAQRARLYE